jgi:hypothetical protein
MHTQLAGAVLNRGGFVGGFREVSFTETEADRKRYAGFVKLTAKIPAAASVAASEDLLPHVAARLTAFTLKDHHGDADYLLVRKHDYNHSVLQQAFTRNKYGLLDQFDDIYLFKKGYDSPRTHDAVSQLGIRRRER